MTLDTYIPRYELTYYLHKDIFTRYEIQHQILMHYILEHDILLIEENIEQLLYDLMYWDLKWYERQDKFEICQAIKDTMENIKDILKKNK